MLVELLAPPCQASLVLSHLALRGYCNGGLENGLVSCRCLETHKQCNHMHPFGPARVLFL